MITGYGDYSIILLFNIIIHSIFMTIIYTSISYFIMKFMYNKFDIKYINKKISYKKKFGWLFV